MPLTRPFTRGISRGIVAAGGDGGGGVSSLLTDLIEYWKLEEASGNRVGQLSAFALVPTNTPGNAAGKIGNALTLVGASSQYVSHADHADLKGGDRAFTLDGWIKPGDVTGVQFILAKGTANSGAGMEYALYLNSTDIRARIAVGAATTDIALGGGLAIGTYYYFAFWFDPVTDAFYGQLNNNTVVSTPIVGAPNTTLGALTVGCSPVLGSFYTGDVDELGRWNKILSATERTARYNGGAGNSYPF